MEVSTPGPASDLIEQAAKIIVESKKQQFTAPYHWAGALWKAGMLVLPENNFEANIRQFADDSPDTPITLALLQIDRAKHET